LSGTARAGRRGPSASASGRQCHQWSDGVHTNFKCHIDNFPAELARFPGDTVADSVALQAN